jgi:hypothetical protein
MVSGIPPVGITKNEHFLSCDTVHVGVRYVCGLIDVQVVCLLEHTTAFCWDKQIFPSVNFAYTEHERNLFHYTVVVNRVTSVKYVLRHPLLEGFFCTIFIVCGLAYIFFYSNSFEIVP